MTTPAEARLEAEEKRRRDSDLRAILATANGRRFVWRLIEGAGAVRASYSGEAMSTSYAEGRRAVGLSLLTEAQRVSPEDFVLMFGEQVAAARLAAQLQAKALEEAPE